MKTEIDMFFVRGSKLTLFFGAGRKISFVVDPSNCHVVIILCDVGGGVPLA